MTLRIAQTHHEHYQDFQLRMRQLRDILVGPNGNGGWQADLAAGARPWTEFQRIQEQLTRALAFMDATAAVPGIGAYIKDQENDQNYDIATEYTSMKTSVVAIRDWIFNNLPKIDQGGTMYLVVQTLDQDGTLTDRAFTPAQTLTLRALIDDFRATVIV